MNEHGWDSVALSGARLVHGDRGETYSHPYDDYSRVATIAAAITPTDFVGMSDEDAAIVRAIYQMIAVKFSRWRHGLEQGFSAEKMRDNPVDACGYIDCLHGALLRIESKGGR